MLTVIAIIGVLAGILIPTIQAAMKRARIVIASADVSHLYQAATAYNLDFGAFPPDSTAFWSPQDNPFPANPNNLNPNELLMWYLTMQYNTGGTTSTAVGYPANWSSPPGPSDGLGEWTPATASVVYSRVNCGPYFDMKAKQKISFYTSTDPRYGFYDFVDPWHRPYMYRAYPQSASVANNPAATITNTGFGPYTITVTLTLNNLTAGGSYSGSYFCTNSNLTNTVGLIQLSGFTTSGASLNGTFAFTGASNQVTFTFTSATTLNSITTYGYYTFPLHNPQTCDIYSLGPYGLTRATYMPQNASNTSPGQEWKPTHCSSSDSPTDPTSLNAWVQVWGTPGDGNDINLPSGGNAVIRISASGNIVGSSIYQDNICNWN
jgi:type II secretory pathway pseudopilin PulG